MNYDDCDLLSLSWNGDDITVVRLQQIETLLQDSVRFKIWNVPKNSNKPQCVTVTHIYQTRSLGQILYYVTETNGAGTCVSTSWSLRNSARFALKLIRDNHDIDIDTTLSKFTRENVEKAKRQGKSIEFRWPESEMMEKHENLNWNVVISGYSQDEIMQMCSEHQTRSGMETTGKITSEFHEQIVANVEGYQQFRQLYEDWDDDKLLEIGIRDKTDRIHDKTDRIRKLMK